MKHYHPQSQQRRLAIVLIGAFLILGINQNFGLTWDTPGPALAILVMLGVCVYLTSGRRVDVELPSGGIHAAWRLAGIPLSRRQVDLTAQRVELIPEWFHWYRDAATHATMDYNLVLAGHGHEETNSEVTLEIKTGQMIFRLAERRARAVGEELGLPVAIRWDLLLDDTDCDSRNQGDWHRPFAYPQELKDWRQWVTW